MVNISKLTKKRLGEILISEGLVNEQQVKEALEAQKVSKELLGEVLIKLGYVTENDIAKCLATQYGIPYINSLNYTISQDVMNLIPQNLQIENQIVPLDKIGNVLLVAFSGVINENLFNEIESKTNCTIFLFVSTVSQVMKTIQNAIAHYQKK